MVIASMFAFTALGYALNRQKFSRTNQDWNGALAAAQAGVDDYIALPEPQRQLRPHPVTAQRGHAGPNTARRTRCG